MLHRSCSSEASSGSAAPHPQKRKRPLKTEEEQEHTFLCPLLSLASSCVLDYLQQRWDRAGLPLLRHIITPHQYICSGACSGTEDYRIAGLGQLLQRYPFSAALVVYTYDDATTCVQVLGILRREAAAGDTVYRSHLQPIGSEHSLRLYGKKRQSFVEPAYSLLHHRVQNSELNLQQAVDWRWRLCALLQPLYHSMKTSIRHEQLMEKVCKTIAAAKLRRYIEDPGFADIERQSHLRCRLLACSEPAFKNCFLEAEFLLVLYKLCELYPDERSLSRILEGEQLLGDSDSDTLIHAELPMAEKDGKDPTLLYFMQHHSVKLPRSRYVYSVPLQFALDFVGHCPFCKECSGLTPAAGRVRVSYLELPYIVATILKQKWKQLLLDQCVQDASTSRARIHKGVPYNIDPRMDEKADWDDEAKKKAFQMRRARFIEWDSREKRTLGWIKGASSETRSLEVAVALDIRAWRQERRRQRELRDEKNTQFSDAAVVQPRDALAVARSHFPACVSQLLFSGVHLKFEARRYLAHYISALNSRVWPQNSKARLWYSAFANSDSLCEPEDIFFAQHEHAHYFKNYMRNAAEKGDSLAPPNCKRAAADRLCPFSTVHNCSSFVQLFQKGDSCAASSSDIEDLGSLFSAMITTSTTTGARKGGGGVRSHQTNQQMCSEYLRTRKSYNGLGVVSIRGPLSYYHKAHQNR